MMVFTVAPRPAGGKKGTPIIVQTNCFKFRIVRRIAFFHYHAILNPASRQEMKNVTRRGDIIKKLYVHDRPNIFQPGQVVYDGKAGLYTTKELGPDRDLIFEVRELGSYEATTRISLQKVGYISQDDFNSLVSQERPTDTALTAQQILNLLLHNATPDEFRRVVKRNCMFSMARADKEPLDSGLDFVRGCFASVRLARDHMLLNVDVCSAIMYDSDGLIEVAMRLMRLQNARGLRNEHDHHKLLTLLSKVRVRQVRAGKVGRVRTIRKLVAGAGYYEFCLEDGTQTTVRDYFLRVHNYRLLYPDLPGISVIKKDRYNENIDKIDVIPFELLEVVEGQFYRRKLEPEVQQLVLGKSTIHPEDRKATIMRHLEAFNPLALNSAGLHLDQNLISVRGRILPPPKLRMAGPIRIEPEGGAWKLSTRRYRKPFYRPANIENVAVLCYERGVTLEDCRELVKKLIMCIGDFGINTLSVKRHFPELLIRFENPAIDKIQLLKSVVIDLARIMGKTPQELDTRHIVLLVILPGVTKGVIYEETKRASDTKASPGLVTQCLSWGKLGQAHGLAYDQYLSNIVLKINAKLGGINFVPLGNGLEYIHNAKPEEAVMVVGLDVSHPGPGIMRPSMAAMVYSVDNYASRYFALCSHQAPRLEVIQDLTQMTYTALSRFCNHVANVFLPAHILIYRDGLSEGELLNVCAEEIEAIKAGIESIWEEAPRQTKKVPLEDVKITYIVVGKRHHIRFFPNSGQADRTGNCPSGFVTDDSSITNPHVYDFFLQSHAGLLGTSRPAHYSVIKDDRNFSADELQSITFGLCHTLARSTCAISVPAPVYYAHLACRRAHIHMEYTGDGSADGSVGSRSSNDEYEPKDWQFFGINELQSRLMYFA